MAALVLDKCWWPDDGSLPVPGLIAAAVALDDRTPAACVTELLNLFYACHATAVAKAHLPVDTPSSRQGALL